MESDGAYAVVTNSESIKRGEMDKPVKILNQTLTSGGTVAADLNHAGFAGWVLVSKASAAKLAAVCF